MAGDEQDLQFERAEFDGAAPAAAGCAVCRSALEGSYYDINGHLACERCKTGLELSMQGGAGPAGFVKSLGLGVLAAIVGALAWFGLRHFTGYEASIVAIGIAWLVGKAVRIGNGGRGGVPYQLLAVLLTYLAIVSTYVPPLVAEMSDTDMPMLVKVVIASVFSLAVPVLGGFENILGLVIIGIGLYYAWASNRRAPLVVTGPHALQPAGEAAQPPPAEPAT